MSAEPKTRIPIDIKLRRCTRCGHFECPHCRVTCDDGMCLFYDPKNPEHVFPEGNLPCEDGQCQYDRPIDTEGYARFDAKAAETQSRRPRTPW